MRGSHHLLPAFHLWPFLSLIPPLPPGSTTSSSPAGLSHSLDACLLLAYISPSTWNALFPLGYLFKSKLELAVGEQRETLANSSQYPVCLLSEASF